MESRTYKDNFRNLILDMVQQELENYVSQRGAKKYFETNVDKVIDENIKKIRTRKDNENLYLKILTYGSYQDNIVSIGICTLIGCQPSFIASFFTFTTPST